MKRTSWLLIGILGIGVIGAYAVPRVVGVDGFSIPGIAFSNRSGMESFTLDGTLEPDDIPGQAQSSDYFPGSSGLNDAMGDIAATIAGNRSSVFAPDEASISAGGPARLPRSVVSQQNRSATEEGFDSVASKREQRIQPPGRLRADANEVYFETERPYSLVQYRSRRTSDASSEGQTAQPRSQHRRAAQQQPAQTEQDLPDQTVSNLPAEHPERLKRSIRSVLAANARRPMTTQHNSPSEILLMSLPYGADAKVYQPNPKANPRDRSTPKGSYIYSIGTLCWNYPCNGKTLLRSDGQRVIAKVGNGYQNRPASLLALLAMSNIMPNYEMKVDGGVYSIANLIASEKAAVSKGSNLSMTLVALAFYGDTRETWKNEMGETWTIEKMVVEELNRTIDQGTNDVTDWLLGLTAAVNLFEEEGRSLRGPMALAKRQLGVYHKFVLSVQNENYLWHPKFFLFKGTSPNAYETIHSGGHILRWLVLSLPDGELENVNVRRAVANLAATLNRIPVNTPAGSLNEKQLEGIAVSLQALSIYHQRVFGAGPLEEPEKTADVDDSKVARR